MNLDHVVDLHLPGAIALRRQLIRRVPMGFQGRMVPQGVRGLGEIDFTSIINRGIDVVGASLAKQPSQYLSPDDPRYRQMTQVPQNQYVYYQNPNYQPQDPKKSSGVGLSVDKNTLVLLGIGLLAFMLGGRR